jgi:multidrug efflux system membrane fusion protein
MRYVLIIFASLFFPCLPVSAADLSATLDWARRAELGTPVSGVISEILVRPGQQVAKGELLLRLDPRGIQARVARFSASLEEARLRRAEAQREFERASELYERTLLSDHERQVAEIAAAAAEAAYRRADAGLTQARLVLEYSQLRAPFEGVVVRVSGAVGEAVASGLRIRPLVVVADNHRMRAKAQLAPDQSLRLQPGQKAQVGIAGGWVDARIEYLGWEPARQAPEETLYDVYVIFDTPARRRLRAGQPVTVRLDD